MAETPPAATPLPDSPSPAPAPAKDLPPTSVEPAPAASEPAPAPVTLNAAAAPAQPAPAPTTTTNNVATATASTTPVVAAPAPKKFTPMNATRKFLEKTSSSSSVPTTSSTPVSASSGNKNLGAYTASTNAEEHSSSLTQVISLIARPAATPSPSAQPSKLVSAKLSNLGVPTAGTPSSWARPPSAAPGDSHAAPGGGTPASGEQAGAQRKRSASPGKPVWGTPNAPARGGPQAPNDFPTAAEAARGWRERPLRANTAHPAAVAASLEPSAEQIRSDAQSKAMAETAAVFRGAHLDPNASHWDEMEEDEDFFQNPIEFGDGTQYNVDVPSEQASRQQSHSSPPPPREPNGAAAVAKDDDEGGWTQVTAKGGAAPSLPSSASATTTSVATPSPLVSPHEAHPPPHSQRALYNDRSNRLEPYNGKPGRGAPAPYRRDSRLSDDGREPPPHRSPTFQLLKHAPGEQPLSKGPMRGPIPSSFDRPPHERERGRPGPGPSAPDNQPPSRGGSGFQPPSRRGTGDMGPPAPPAAVRRGTGDMGPPPPPTQRGPPSAAGDREAPPHLGRITPSRMTNGRDSPVSVTSSRMSTRDRALSIASSAAAPMSIGKVAPPEPELPPSAPALTPGEQEELMKTYQHELAEKARRRRIEEEAEREQQKERARAKAAELEERMAREKQEKVSYYFPLSDVN
ncbi:hypothetical protein EXIGLDRAFT_512031 [Exidia glandulosa HHB12029]|uniref:Uncharacterized protein n=1 Tax=Exidia glandulosa HHB12029 TaxID=1314781 RepID=A0A165PES3_EXIGL|nr:hypothetical protein EXIGLDRAFT_512031 [Exidia glandulosa HHB12029]